MSVASAAGRAQQFVVDKRRPPPPNKEQAKSIELYRLLSEQIYRFDFYHALRCLECVHAERARIGTSAKPDQDPVRFAQQPSMAFAPSTIASFEYVKLSRPRLEVFFFGLFGPNGPLPLHLTEFTRERIRNDRDFALARFVDLFHHRLISLFYRVWADAQPTTQFDRPQQDRFFNRVGALVGLGSEAMQQKNRPDDFRQLYFAGQFSPQARNREGLEKILSEFLDTPIVINEFVGQWLDIAEADLLFLDERCFDKPLGQATTLGERVWECQGKLTIRCGPLELPQFEQLLPGSHKLRKLAALVQSYLGFGLDWELQLILKGGEIPHSHLGLNTSLGWTTWVGEDPFRGDFTELFIQANAEYV